MIRLLSEGGMQGEKRVRESKRKNALIQETCVSFSYSLLSPFVRQCRGSAAVEMPKFVSDVSRVRDYICDSLAKFSWRLTMKNRIHFRNCFFAPHTCFSCYQWATLHIPKPTSYIRKQWLHWIKLINNLNLIWKYEEWAVFVGERAPRNIMRHNGTSFKFNSCLKS